MVYASSFRWNFYRYIEMSELHTYIHTYVYVFIYIRMISLKLWTHVFVCFCGKCSETFRPFNCCLESMICPEQLTAMTGRHPSQPHPLLGDAALQFTTGSPHPSSVSANLLDLCLHLEQASWIWAGQFNPMMLSSPHLSHFMLTS